MQVFLTNSITIKRENNFYVIVSYLMLLVVLVGFGPRYFLKAPFEPNAIPLHIHIHALVFTGWIILFIIQIKLVRFLKYRTHIQLGYWSVGLAVLMVFYGINTAISGAINGHNPGGPFADEFGFMIVSIGDMLIFSLFYILGYRYRRKADYHKRCMLLATVGGLLFAPISRLPYIAGQFPLLMVVFIMFILLSPIFDLISFKRIHPVNIWGPLLIILSIPLRTFIGMTDTWHRIAVWTVEFVEILK